MTGIPLRPFARAAGLLASLLLVANCTQPGTATQAARDLPETAAPQPAASRARTGELACLAEAVYFEARGTGSVGESAVAHVVVNRAKSPQFPGTVCGVVGDGCQFSYRCDGRSDALADAGPRARAYKVAAAVLGGAPDFTSGALFFHSAQAAPGWFKSRPRIGVFGGNVFYR
jgi:spore germination cell wall hydrolase CwlJ-like protein